MIPRFGKPRKYRNQPTVVDGIRFDSKREAYRYRELLILEQNDHIFGLKCHPRFDLIVNGKKVGFYKPDFTYFDSETGHRVVEDVKSGPTKTPVYRLKKRIMLAQYGITIREI